MGTWRLSRWLPGAVAITVLLLPAAASQVTPPPPTGLPQSGPDVPAVTAPLVVTVFQDETVAFTQTVRSKVIDVPTGDWDRVVLEFTERPEGDAWDRVFGVAIGTVEILHGTTPRTEFTLRKDITHFASLLPPGGQATVHILIEAWAGVQKATVKLEFYSGEPTAALVEAPWDQAIGAFRWNGLCGRGQALTKTIDFGADAKERVLVEFTFSGHGDMEGVFNVYFDLFVDGVKVAQAVTFPYRYAFIGFYPPEGPILHPFMWWTAQRALDVAGVHTGVGEIPPYRAELRAEDLGLFSGAHTVSLVQRNIVGCLWVTSLTFLTS
jgi:hypothetical protein